MCTDVSAVRTGLALLIAVSCGTALHAQRTSMASSLSGVVHDSLAAQVLSGATVELVRQGGADSPTRTVVSDSLGRFRFVDVPPGRVLLRFQHPALDRLGVEPAPRVVLVPARTSIRANLAIPSPTTLRLELCGDDAVRDSLALIIGHALHARDRTALDSVIVTATWRRRAAGSTAAPDIVERRRVAASPNGWFVICAARSGDAIQLVAQRNTIGATFPPLTMPATGVLQQDLLLGDVRITDQARGVADRATVPTPDPRTPPTSTPDTLAVDGVVVRADDGRPIAGAIVAMQGGGVTRSDTLGAWRLSGVRRGTRTVSVRAVRYAPLSATIAVSPQMPPVRLTMLPIAARLETVRVSAERDDDRVLADFLERRRTRGSGTFLTEDDIRSRQLTVTSDVFRSVQGGVTIERDSLGNRYLAMRSNTFRAPRCQPSMFIDGMSMRGLTTGDLDGLLQPQQLLGIEVYRAANAPVEFAEQDGCGTILIWTKK